MLKTAQQLIGQNNSLVHSSWGHAIKVVDNDVAKLLLRLRYIATEHNRCMRLNVFSFFG